MENNSLKVDDLKVEVDDLKGENSHLRVENQHLKVSRQTISYHILLYRTSGYSSGST